MCSSLTTLTNCTLPSNAYNLLFCGCLFLVLYKSTTGVHRSAKQQVCFWVYGRWEIWEMGKDHHWWAYRVHGFYAFHRNCTPSTHDYWKRDEVTHYAPVARRISRNRFFEIQRYLHFADNSTLAAPGTPEYNKLGKIQPIIHSLLENFQTAYNLHRDISVDEAMVPFKGRSTLKQYMPMKPVKRGFKVWMLADAHTGYVCSLHWKKRWYGWKGTWS